MRIEFFGDEIDEIRVFDPTDQRTIRPADAVELLPASEFLVPAGGIGELRARLGRLAGRLPERLAADLARFEGAAAEGGAPTAPGRATASALPGSPAGLPGPAPTRALDVGDAAEVWAAVVCPATGLDHLDPATLLVLDEPGEVAAAAEFLWDQAAERRRDLVAAGELPATWPDAYLAPRDWKGRLLAGRTLELTWESGGFAAIGGGAVLDDAFGWREPVLPPGRSAGLVRAIERWRAGATASVPRIVLASDQATRLAELLGDAGIPVGVTIRPGVPPPGAVALVGRSLNAGFAGGPDGLVVVTDRELFGTVRVRRPKALRRVVPRDILERLTPGDLVVHVDHGIARYERMLRRGGAGEERDYLELSFAAGDRIFVPVEQVTRVTRYAGAERPALSRLGGTEWARTTARVRRAVADLADDLLRLYAARAAAEGHAFGPDTPWQQELEASFPYEETVDQLRAIAEVKADMETVRPMDRIVVGDVGYGKTEIALRAAFKAIEDGRQVAVLVPTTVLADQHVRTFEQRFAAFPATVRLLSRAVPPREQAATLAGLAAGSVDLVVGTHRLLSKDVRFRDLGLLVVDEEQRFGVAAKERLKQLRTEVDVLTLSATPIPRTLNLALVGVRDLSVIETPPEDRLPIQTRVAEASAGLVKDAILRELDRGGQVFFVHNRVETIEAQADQLRRLLPAARIVVGHGQMSEGALETVMRAFAGGRGRRPRLHHDHRVRPRHPERQHDHHRPRRRARPGPALPAARPGRAEQPAGLRVPPLPPSRPALRRGPPAAAGDLQRVGAGGRLPDRPGRPRDPRCRQHPRRGAVRPHGRRRLRPLHAPPRRGGRGAQGDPRGPRAGAGRRRRHGRPARGRAPPGQLRPRRGPEARALPASRPRPDRGRSRGLPPGGRRPLRTAAAARPPPRGGRRAPPRRGGGRDRLARPRGGPARRPIRERALARGGDAPRRRARPCPASGPGTSPSPPARSGSAPRATPPGRGPSRRRSWRASRRRAKGGRAVVARPSSRARRGDRPSPPGPAEKR